tara:strand:+ start:1241 stop:1744 length:504 start_codon:yes stop_codon:yes gene_type:complete
VGTSITTQAQVRNENGRWEDVNEDIFTAYGMPVSSPFTQQNYDLFSLLAGVRNYAIAPVIKSPVGLPPEPESSCQGEWGFSYSEPCSIHEGNHSKTWYLLSELLKFDYEKIFENRRSEFCSSDTVPEGEGRMMSLRQFVGSVYFDDLAVLSTLADSDDVRVIMSFES